jgi:hypothetical protein
MKNFLSVIAITLVAGTDIIPKCAAQTALGRNAIHSADSAGKISWDAAARGVSAFGDIHGITRDPSTAPLAEVEVTLHSLDENTDRTVFSGNDGAFIAQNLRPGSYQVIANKEGFATSVAATVQLAGGESLRDDITLASLNRGAASTSTSSATNGDVALTEREKQLLDRIDRLEQRLAAIEAQEGVQPQQDRKAVAAQPLLASLVPPASLPVEKSTSLSIMPLPAVTTATKPSPISVAAAPVQQAVVETAPQKTTTAEPFAYADWTWLNGNPRTKDSPLQFGQYFTGEFRSDTHYMIDYNHPRDDTLGGSTESFRSNEVQVEQLSFGGDLRVGNVRGRFLTMYGLFATTTPRNDASPGRGQWDLRDAYRYVSEAWGGYHFNVNHGLNFDGGIFVSYIGLFSYYNFDNWTYQPSFVSSNAPWFFNGLRVQWFPTDKLKIEPWFINGWQSLGRYNSKPGLGGQILWRPKPWLSFVFNNYGMGEDTLGVPNRSRFHTDNSVQVKYFDREGAKGLDKMAFSLTGNLGCEHGGGVSCFGDHSLGPKQSFAGWMLYNRFQFHRDLFGLTVGGGKMNNPGRYLTLLPPINGADAISGSPYFTLNPGDQFKGKDSTITVDYMPSQFITFRWEVGWRNSNVPYWSGRGGITPPGGNNGSPQFYACNSGASTGTADLSAATSFCSGAGSSVWFPDLRKSQSVANFALLVKF